MALVSCVNQKRGGRFKAHDLYVSDWFKKAKRHVMANYHHWHILSAKYYLLQPEKPIDYYQLYLPKTPLDYRKKWAMIVFQQIEKLYRKETEIHIYAGEHYRKYLVPLLEEAGYKVTVPLTGLGIGQQMHWFDKQQA